MKAKLSLALLSTIIASSVAAQSNTIRFDKGDKLPSIPAYSTGVSTPAESTTLLEMMPVNFNSTVTSALMATKDGEPVPMSSCLAYIEAGLGQGNDGLYQITNNGSTYPVYCNQTSFGGGFTLVVAQFESVSVAWSGYNNGVTGGSYNPSLSSGTSFSLSNAQIPAHTFTGFSQQGFDGMSVPHYITFNYHGGNINKTLVEGEDGQTYHIYRNTGFFYSNHDPESTNTYSHSLNNNTLSIDRTGGLGFTFTFQAQHNTPKDRGFAYGGSLRHTGVESGAYLVWVK